MSDENVPVRACRFRLDLQGDTREEICRALMHIQRQLEIGELTTGVSGGCGSGFVYEYAENKEPTHDQYFEQLTAYLEKRKNVAAPPTEQKDGLVG